MLNSEKAFDMLPEVVELWDKLNIDEYRKQLAKDNKVRNLSKNDLGIEIFKYILKNSSKAKENFFEIVAIFEDKTVEEVKAQSYAKTVSTLKSIFTDKEAVAFFKEAVR